jgi:peroxiredoxin
MIRIDQPAGGDDAEDSPIESSPHDEQIASAALAPGSPAPHCMLLDMEGQDLEMSQLYARRPLVLIFYRGHWCPYCRRQLQRLQDVHDRIDKMGVTLAAVTVDPPSLSRQLAADLGIRYPLLSDTGGKAIDAFGVRNRLLGKNSDVPHPAIFVIDPAGRVRFREVRRNYRRRISPGRLLRIIDSSLLTNQG